MFFGGILVLQIGNLIYIMMEFFTFCYQKSQFNFTHSDSFSESVDSVIKRSTVSLSDLFLHETTYSGRVGVGVGLSPNFFLIFLCSLCVLPRLVDCGDPFPAGEGFW